MSKFMDELAEVLSTNKTTEFKIMKVHRPCAVKTVPMWYAKQFNEQAVANHGQTIERLNERGGLSPSEFYLVAHDLPSKEWKNISEEMAISWLESEFTLLAKLKKYEQAIADIEASAVCLPIADPVELLENIIKTIDTLTKELYGQNRD